MTTVKLYRKGGKKDFRIDKRNGMFFVFEGAKCLREYLTTVEEAEHQINLIVLNRKKMNMETVPILKADGTTYAKPIKFSAKNPKEKTCVICSQSFVDETFALRRKFCSDECKKKGHAMTNKAANQKYQKRLKEKKDFEKRMNDLFAIKQGILLTKNKKEKLEFRRYESAQLEYFFYTLQLWKETRIKGEGGVTRRSFVKKGSCFNLSKEEFANYIWKCGLVYSDEPIPTEEQISENTQDIFNTTPEEKVKENKDSVDFEAENQEMPFGQEMDEAIKDFANKAKAGQVTDENLMDEILNVLRVRYSDEFLELPKNVDILNKFKTIFTNSIPKWRSEIQGILNNTNEEEIADDPFNREEPIIRDYMKEEPIKFTEREKRNRVEMYVDIVINTLRKLYLNNNASFEVEMPKYIMSISGLIPISYSEVVRFGHICEKGISQNEQVKEKVASIMIAKKIVPTDEDFEDAQALWNKLSNLSPLSITDALSLYTNDVLKAIAMVSENQVDLAKRFTELDLNNHEKIGQMVQIVNDSSSMISKSIEQSSHLITLVNESFDREKQLYEIIENMRGTIAELQQKVSELPKKKKGWF